mgnify:CR=1 FL=1
MLIRELVFDLGFAHGVKVVKTTPISTQRCIEMFEAWLRYEGFTSVSVAAAAFEFHEVMELFANEFEAEIVATVRKHLAWQ